MKPMTPFRYPVLSCALLGLILAPGLLLAADSPQPVVPAPAIPATPAQEEAHPPSFPLWPNGAPGYEGRRDEPERVDWRQEPDIVFPVTFNIHSPSLTPFLPAAGKATGAAVIIAPGGGDMFLTMDREGYDLGSWMADHGVAAFVLKYRLARDRAGNSPYKAGVEPLADALRAVRTVRARAQEWGVIPSRVGFVGFSAGGAVAALAMTRYDAGRPDAGDPVERQSSRPDFAALLYPGIAALVSGGGLGIDAQTPPAFLSCAADDQPATVANLANLFLQLRRAGVSAELHIYSAGGHGYGVRQRPLEVTGWPSQMLGWMGDQGLLRKP